MIPRNGVQSRRRVPGGLSRGRKGLLNISREAEKGAWVWSLHTETRFTLLKKTEKTHHLALRRARSDEKAVEDKCPRERYNHKGRRRRKGRRSESARGEKPNYRPVRQRSGL